MNWHTTLSRLEARLQSLVEGSAARLFPGGQAQGELQRHLLRALHDAVQVAESDTAPASAPTHFTLALHPTAAAVWQANPTALEELTGWLAAAGSEAGLSFPSPLTLQVIADSSLKPGENRVIAEILPPAMGKTARLRLPNNGAAASDAYLILNGGQIFNLQSAVTNIGRRMGNHLVLDDPRISRSHAQIRLGAGRAEIFDLESSGGVYVNGQRVKQAALRPGDVISLAGVQVIFGEESEPPLDETQPFSPADGGDFSR